MSDDRKPVYVPPLDATPSVYSSLDAPPPPFQLQPPPSGRPPGPTRTPAARRLTTHPAYRSRPKPRVQPAAVKVAGPVPPPRAEAADLTEVADVRPERLPLDANNPGAVVAVAVSLVVSVMVFLLAV